jgi:tetratricopeptide (TPR) repeat protein
LLLPLEAESFLISPGSHSPSYEFQTSAGRFLAQISPLKPPTKLSLLVHRDSLTDPQWQEAQARIINLHGAAKSVGGFELHVITRGLLKSWQPFPAQSQLTKVLASLSASVQPEAQPRSSQGLSAGYVGAVYSDIGRYLPKPSAEWQSLILIAPEPPLKPEELRFYTAAHISWQFRQKRVRLFHWPVSEAISSSESNLLPNIWPSVALSSCGRVLRLDEELRTFLDEWKVQTCQQVDVAGPTLSQGFFPYHGRLVAKESLQAVRELSGLWLAAGVSPISPDQYAQMLHLLDQAREALRKRDAQALRPPMEQALRLNPLHEPTLRFAAEIYQQQKDWQTALKLLSPLLEVLPDDSDLLNQVANLQFELKQWQDSERHYSRSLKLRPGQPEPLEKLIAIREALGDVAGSLNYAKTALDVNPQRASLQVRYGELLEKTGKVAASALAYEQALQLDPNLESVRRRLVEIYVSQKAPEKAADALRAAATIVPKDGGLRLRYAELGERVALPAEAERFYHLALEADGALEPAHFGLAQLWAGQQQLQKSLDAANRGLESNSNSVRLLLLKATLLSQLDRRLESRQMLEEAFRVSPKDPQVLAQTATMRDIHGDRAGEAYEALAATLAQQNPTQPAIKTALERGLVVSLRDGERDRAIQFANRLRELGANDIPDLSLLRPHLSNKNTVTVPGGMKALAFAALMHEEVGSDRFAADYASTVARMTRGKDGKSREAYLDSVRAYFRTMSALKAEAGTNGASGEIVLSTADKPSLERTEKTLKLLGWKLKYAGKKISLEVSSKESDATKQPYLAVMGVDEIQMKSALEAGSTFTLRVKDEQVPIIFDEKFWLERVIEKVSPPGGLFEAFLENLGATRFYSGLAQMNDEAQQQVMRVAEPKKLLGRYADLLASYGAALSVVNGQIMLPGGSSAAPVWQQFAGSKPQDPPAFLTSLLSRNDGKPLAFFNLLTNLPPLQQRFFTKSPARLNSFYKAFPFTEREDLKRHAVIRRDVYFRDLARELPLDEEGNINFPGSAQIWLVAKGGSSDTGQVSKLLRKATKKALPEVEDEILLRLLDTEYEVDGDKFNQVENFLALVRLERHRTHPLDEATALLLSQNYARYRGVFPLFATLPDLSSQNLTSFFQACRNLESLAKPLLNQALGEFQGVLQLVVLLFENGAMEESTVVSTFAATCERFAKAKEPYEFAQATLESLRSVMDELKPSRQALATASSPKGIAPDGTAVNQSDSWDDRLLAALTGPAKRVSFRLQDKEYALDRATQQREKMREILQLQSATSLDTLRQIRDAVSSMIQGDGETSRSIEEIEIAIPQLKEIDVQTQKGLSNNLRERIYFAKPEEIHLRLAKIRKEAAKEKPKDLPKLVADLLGELNPYLKNSLVGWIYSYYFSPQDLVIAQDPLFVRRHELFRDGTHHKVYWPPAEQRSYNQEGGIFVEGVLFQLGPMAGRLGLTQVESDKSFSGHNTMEAVAATQIASLRSLAWARLNESDLHAAGVASVTVLV